MKNTLKYLIFIILMVPCLFLFAGCSLFLIEEPKAIENIEKIETKGLTDTYRINYNDGTFYDFYVTNGTAGETPEVISIVDVQKTKTEGLVDTYTIYYSNDTTSTFTITNGVNGIDGANTDAVSIDHISKASTDGLVDTYTIYYTNNTTSTFTITNGINGIDGENGQDLSFQDLYNAAIAGGFKGSALDFIQAYLNIDTNTTTIAIATNRSLLSAVSIHAGFGDGGSAGAGVIYQLNKTSGDAYIITNYHVVYDNEYASINNGISTNISIYLYGYPTYLTGIPVTYIGGSMTYDIAVLKITNSEILRNSDALAIEIQNSDNIVVGETAIAIGNPENEGIAANCGIISVDSESITMTAPDKSTSTEFRVIRIDTAVNHGNSGGGLFDSEGKLIGIVNARCEEDGVIAFNYAIPSNVAINVAQNLIDYNISTENISKVRKIVVGLSLTGEKSRSVYDSETLTTRIKENVTVNDVISDSIASSRGFQIGDVITHFQINENEVLEINRVFTLIDSILDARAGDEIKFTLKRNGENQIITHVIQASDLVEII